MHCQDETDDENSQELKTSRKQSSPKSFARPESPVLKRRKLPTEDIKKDHKPPLALVKTEPDFYGGDSHDESEDQKPQSLSLSHKLDKNYDNNYSDENMDGSSEIGIILNLCYVIYNYLIKVILKFTKNTFLT